MKQRLKFLELHGYKTFVSKTRFEFPEQLTAIVGPNGSGKSNIADAVRWVLGEQAYSLLRGKKTIDMIFAGSELRPRASMASATIVFNNEDGWLPIDFSEVSLTRRAYRSGENEYLLNNTRVRLKEINELLANSGLSERTYTIIGQGLVDSALSLRPEERRRFFEEAAGIELYRSRRDEAIQKLDNTRRNMERVQDILSELTPRLKSLEKQSERAREYDRMKADLFILLKDWYGFQWKKIQDELSYAQDMLHTQDKNLSDARQVQLELDEKIETTRKKIAETRAELAQWHQQSAERHLMQEKNNREIAVLEEREKAFEEKKREIDHRLALLEEENNTQQEILVELEEEKKKRNKEFQKSSQEYESINQKLDERLKKRQLLENEIGSVRSTILELETRILQIKVQSEELDRRISVYEDDHKTIASNHKKDLDELEENRKNISHQKALIDQIDEKINGTEEKLQTCVREIEEKEARFRKIQEKISQEKGKSISFKAQIEVLEQAERSLSGFTSGTKNILDAVQKGTLSGHYEVLLSKIQVPAEYELAIASILGEVLEALILDEKADPEKVLSYLESSESARTVLLPKAWLQIKGDRRDQSFEQATPAFGVVTTHEDFKPILQTLLHNVFIVKDRKSARQLIESTSADIKCVTSKGEIFNSNGAVIAGRELRVKAISRIREKQDLIQKNKEIDNNIENLEKNTEELLIQIKEVNKIKVDFENKSRELQKEKNQLINKLNSVDLLLQQKVNKIKWQDEQIQNLILQTDNCKKEKENLLTEKNKIDHQVNDNRNKLNTISKEFEKFPLEELQERLISSRTQRTIDEQTQKTAEIHEGDVRKKLEEIKRERGDQGSLLNECVASLKSLNEQKKNCLLQEADFEKNLSELNNKIEPAEKTLNELETDLITFLEEQEKGRQRFSVAERHNIQAQMKLTRIREQQENLRKKIEEDFGLVYYEYGQTVEGPTPLPIDGMVENLPKLKSIPIDLEENIKQQKSILRRIGPINPEAQKEFQEVQERHQFITDQLKDLEKAEGDLRQIVTELDGLMKTEFEKTFHAVNEVFKTIFKTLFDGGSAELVISDLENVADSGIDIHATLPGKRKQELASLSGGERSLTAVALIFALLKVSPTPFCILDEVDAMLDESNVMRFGDLLRDLSETTQFIVITHNRNTVQLANVLYGVTMGKDSTSQVISLKLEELTEDLVQ